MIDRRAILLSCLLLTAGCTEGGPPSVEVVLDLGPSSMESGQFAANGQIRANAHLTNQQFTFEEISVVMYDENEKRIGSTRVGEISTRPGENAINVSLSAPSTPAYILVESPEFWESEVEVSISGYKRTETNYSEFKYDSRDERFP